MSPTHGHIIRMRKATCQFCMYYLGVDSCNRYTCCNEMEVNSELSNGQSLCDTCGQDLWKYRCPGCGTRTCSLSCVKRHKTESGCDGRRCKTTYVSLSEFDNNQLHSDYHFLEDVGRFVDSSRRDRVCMTREQSVSRELKQNCFRLRNASERRGTQLILLPHGMSQHIINTSRTKWHGHKRGCEIMWRVHLNFPQCTVEYQEESVSENTVLSSLLQKYIHPRDSDPIARHRLRRYVQGGGVDSVEVFMKAERIPSKNTRYYSLDKEKSLRDNLVHKTVIEFPVLHVVLRSASEGYPIYNGSVSSDSNEHKADKSLQQFSVSKSPGNSTVCQQEPVSQHQTDTPPLPPAMVHDDGTKSLTDSSVNGTIERDPMSNSLQLIAQMYSDNEESD